MFYTYILGSLKRQGELYIGSTNDLKRRLIEHNTGKVFSTKRYLPWRLKYYEAYTTENLARNREQGLKHHGNAMKELKKRICDSEGDKGSTQHHFLHAKSGAGFTLVELLTVISLIGLFASIVMVATNNARIQARDARRKQDALIIRTALQWYYHDNGYYPNRGTVGNANHETDIQDLYGFLVPKYVNTLPNDPKKIPENYQYVWRSNGQEYGLYVPYSNDGGMSCQYQMPTGNKNWFGKAMVCPN